MKIDNSIVEKIKKLFALATDNPNENEAASALNRAKKMMRDYNLTQIDIEKSEIEIDIKRWESDFMSQIDSYNRTLADAVGRLFDCEPILFRYGKIMKYKVKMTYVGDESDIAIASQVWPYLTKICKQKACARFGKSWTPKHRSYAEAFAETIAMRVEEIKSQERKSKTSDDQQLALVVMEKESRIAKYLEDFDLKMKRRSYTGKNDVEAIRGGIDDAKKVKLNFRSQIAGEQTKQITY